MSPVSHKRNRKISGAIIQVERMSPSPPGAARRHGCRRGARRRFAERSRRGLGASRPARTHLDRLCVGALVLEQPIRSSGCRLGVLLARGDELRALVGRQGQQFTHTIHQRVQIAVHQPVEAIASRPRRIESHHRLVATVQRVQRANAQLERLGLARHDGADAVHDDERDRREHEQQQRNRPGPAGSGIVRGGSTSGRQMYARRPPTNAGTIKLRSAQTR